jgi:hypothetical protein
MEPSCHLPSVNDKKGILLCYQNNKKIMSTILKAKSLD